MPAEFLYFDLGKVIVDFSIERMCRQMGNVRGSIRPRSAMSFILLAEQDQSEPRGSSHWPAAIAHGGLEFDYECGRISSRQFSTCFANGPAAGPTSTPCCGRQRHLLAESVDRAGDRPACRRRTSHGHSFQHQPRPLGLLSGPLSAAGRKLLNLRPEFSHWPLQAGRGNLFAAAELAGCRPEQIFYVDDIAGHVAGARSVGFDAVQYVSTPELRRRTSPARGGVQLLSGRCHGASSPQNT